MSPWKPRFVTVICAFCTVVALMLGEHLAAIWALVAAFAFEEPNSTRRRR